MRRQCLWTLLLAVGLVGLGCSGNPAPEETGVAKQMNERLAKYTTVRLEADLSVLSDKERRMIPLLEKAADVMDDLYWEQAYGDKAALLERIQDPSIRRLVEINYGPWDRLDGDAPFVPGVGPKPPGANFYPRDMTKKEFAAAVATAGDGGAQLKSLYTLVRRDAAGSLVAQPYHDAYREQLGIAAGALAEAAGLAEEPGLRLYLKLRSEALLTDDYRRSDFAWMDMKDNIVDLVIGPIETYEDKLFGYKASYEAYILIKDVEWSQRLERFAALLPELQRGLPVPEKYKKEKPGTDSDLGAYDVIRYAGDCNAGAKTIAINLPNDETVQLEKGTRRLQLKNAMRAKFDKILIPMAKLLIADDQLSRVTFDAFFANTMFHEVAHGLGIKNTITGKGPVRQAMRDKASALEEGKADIVGLYLVGKLKERGELGDGDLMDNYVTFLAGIFRSIRFGASSAHGIANLVRFNYFRKLGAFSRDETTGTYRVNFDKMREAVNSLSEKIIRLQGDGDYEGAVRFIREMSVIPPALASDLDRVGKAGIPVDVIFEQGDGAPGV